MARLHLSFSAMPKAHTDWNVLPHGPIEKLADNIWRVEGTLPNMTLRRVMVLVKLADGRLLIHNGIALDETSMKEIEAWGTPAILVVPNRGHRLDAPAYKKRFPALQVLAPSGARTHVEEVLPVDATCETFPEDGTIRFEAIAGVGNSETAMWIRSGDGISLVLNDIVFNMDKKKDFLGWFFTTVMGSAPGPRVSRLAKFIFVKDKRALRADLERFAGTPNLTRLFVAHEKVASGAEASDALRTAATYL